MQEIKCPKCGTMFQIDDAEYKGIAAQVRDREFEKELRNRQALFESKAAKEKQDTVFEARQMLQERDGRIKELQARLDMMDAQVELAVAKALQEKQKELSGLQSEVVRLQGDLEKKDAERKLAETSVKEQYEERLKEKDDQIAYYKDFKLRLSTKMVGESLEQYCLSEFNKVRAMAFPRAYFEKDNEVKEGSKGDFIFRESSGDGVEFLSIMFEMKNEADATAAKHRNEDFFKELDKERKAKGCEYAVLVSMLEADNEFYNQGITEVYRYEKMYVVRPQFFIPFIGLLRNMALGNVADRRALQEMRSEQIDLCTFEKNMEDFKDAFGRNYRIASEKFRAAVDEIDKTITHLQKVKDALVSSENNLRLANDKAEGLSMKKLAKGAPSVLLMMDASRTGNGGGK